VLCRIRSCRETADFAAAGSDGFLRLGINLQALDPGGARGHYEPTDDPHDVSATKLDEGRGAKASHDDVRALLTGRATVLTRTRCRLRSYLPPQSGPEIRKLLLNEGDLTPWQLRQVQGAIEQLEEERFAEGERTNRRRET